MRRAAITLAVAVVVLISRWRPSPPAPAEATVPDPVKPPPPARAACPESPIDDLCYLAEQFGMRVHLSVGDTLLELPGKFESEHRELASLLVINPSTRRIVVAQRVGYYADLQRAAFMAMGDLIDVLEKAGRL